ncbi:hypothetical protein PO909_013154 [Leuciscus waleckii]
MVVGKRFLCVSGEEPLEPAHIARWSWRTGVIRAVTHRDHDNPELTYPVLFVPLPWGPETGACSEYVRVRFHLSVGDTLKRPVVLRPCAKTQTAQSPMLSLSARILEKMAGDCSQIVV